jgi:hypothetical protein
MFIQKTLLRNNLVAIAIITFLVVIAVQQIAFAATYQGDALNELIKQNQEIDAWWDQVLKQTFNPGVATGGSNISDYIFNNIARMFLFIGCIFWVWNLGLEIAALTSGSAAIWTSMAKLLWPVVMMSILLANNGAAARAISSTARAFGQNSIQALYQARVIDITIQDAMSDIFITQTVAAQIAEQVQACSAMPHPNVPLPSPTRPTNPTTKLTLSQTQAYDYLHCFEGLQEFVNQQQSDAQSKTCTSLPGIKSSCTFTLNFLNKTAQSFSTAFTKTLNNNPLGLLNPFGVQLVMMDYLQGLGTSAAYRPLLATIQYWAISFMEMALWVDALVAPLAISVAIIPARLNFTAGWLISILTIVLAQIMNAVVSGIAALQLAQSTTYFLSDTRFDFALGILAPLCAFAVIGGGGFFAARTFLSTGVTAATSVVGVASSVSTSIVSGVSRAISRKK